MNKPWINYIPFLFAIVAMIFWILIFIKEKSNQIKYNTSIQKEYYFWIDFPKIKRIINNELIGQTEKRDFKRIYLYIRLLYLMAVLFILSAIIITIKK